MSLYIIEKHNGVESNSEWHVGEPMPFVSPKSRVVTFQADGDELDMILRAMNKSHEPADDREPVDCIGFNKVGFVDDRSKTYGEYSDSRNTVLENDIRPSLRFWRW